jgi:branched-subunit amino acid transport protein
VITENLWMVVGVAFLAAYVWRALGMVIASRLNPESPLSRWFTCVAYAVLAGLIARMIIIPEGALADAPLPDKLIALACGFVVFSVQA